MVTRAKIVAVQNGLHDIANKLRDIGYKVVNIDETQYQLDAIVYSTSLSNTTNQVDTIELNNAYNDGYVLMLNADEYS
ncbi:MAG: hypothetical protein PWQ67_2725 [Clostridia bacterium]|nr:hypothetical protein [Clostridia bacterium]MDN5324271.1 hypothetical protein [Clostridia bacterium]